MADELVMEIRRADMPTRTITGVVAPYDETSYLVPVAAGERIRRGAFARTLRGREAKVPLLRNHSGDRVLGRSRRFSERPEGLVGDFVVNAGHQGDELLTEVRDGYLSSMSVGFRALDAATASDGVREIVDAYLVEVSLVGVPAYSGAEVMALRRAEIRRRNEEAMPAWMRQPLPQWDLGPHDPQIRPRWRR